MNYIPKTDITGQRLELDFNDMFLKTGDPSSNERMQAVQNIKSYSELFKTSGNPFTRDHKDDSKLPSTANDRAMIDPVLFVLKDLAPVHSRQEKENESGLRKDRSLPICEFMNGFNCRNKRPKLIPYLALTVSQAQEANYDHSTASKKESGIGKDHSLPIRKSQRICNDPDSTHSVLIYLTVSTVDKADRERHQNAQKSQYYALARRASNGNRLLPLRDTGRHNRSPNHTPFFSPIMGHKATGNKVVYRPPAFRHSHGIASDGETEHTESQQIATPVPLAHKEQLPIHNSSQNRIVSKTNASAMLEKGDRVGERFANLGKAIRPGYNIPMGSADIFSSAGPFSSSTPLTYVKPTAGKAVQSRVPSLRPGYESNSDADDTYDFSRSLSSSLSALSTSQSSRSSSLAENSMDSRLLEGEQEILMEDAEADLMDLKSLPPANPYGQNFLVSEEVSDSESSDSSPEKGDVTMTESRFETGYLLKPRYVSGVPVPPFLPSSVYMTDIVKVCINHRFRWLTTGKLTCPCLR
jgi:hypothetical protein